MPGRVPESQHPDPRVGLCSRCLHARTVETARGSTFWLCGRSATDPGFRKYPPLPVLHCPGFEPAPEEN